MGLSELLIPCLIGHKIQALRLRVGAGQNNQNSGQTAWQGTTNFDSTAPRKLSSEGCDVKVSKDQKTMRDRLDWAKSLADMKNVQ